MCRESVALLNKARAKDGRTEDRPDVTLARPAVRSTGQLMKSAQRLQITNPCPHTQLHKIQLRSRLCHAAFYGRAAMPLDELVTTAILQRVSQNKTLLDSACGRYMQPAIWAGAVLISERKGHARSARKGKLTNSLHGAHARPQHSAATSGQSDRPGRLGCSCCTHYAAKGCTCPAVR